MPLTAEERDGLDLLLNESVLLDAELDPGRCLLGLTFYVEMIPERGERATEDLYLQLLLHGIGRLAVSFRQGASWFDRSARLEQLELDELGAALGRIHYPDAIYGRRFFDVPGAREFTPWRDLVSVEFTAQDHDETEEAGLHTLTVWNDELELGRDREQRLFFDLRAWFERVSIRDRLEQPVELGEAIAASRRYWDAVRQRGSGGPSPYPAPHVRIPLPG